MISLFFCTSARGLLVSVPMIRFHRAKTIATLLVITLLAAPIPTLAMGDPMVDGARQCTQYFPREEQRNAIPAHLLAAIASTESGRWHTGLGMALPWPWTINVEGKGYYFSSKAEAIARVAALQRSGIRSIDVGCMQVNLKHHPDAFASLDDAFEPSHNVAYGAKFLRANYDDLGDWVKATAAYHSRTPIYGREYLSQIEKSWNRIVSKVQQARTSQGMVAANVAQPQFSTTPLTAPHSATNTLARPVRVASGLQPLHDAHHAKIIQVSEQQVRPAQTLVILGGETMPATSALAPVKIADARDVVSPHSEMLVRGASDTVRQVRIDNAGAFSDSSRGDTSSRFVFAN